MSAVKFGFFCICGTAMTGAVGPDRTEDLRVIFASAHRGEGHGPTDSKGAYNARRKADRQSARAALATGDAS